MRHLPVRARLGRRRDQAGYYDTGARGRGISPFGIEPRFGIYADLTIATEHGRARQRPRWISPGTFLMGSPEDESGRGEDEGPRHEVTISQGFWLFDTPCTQALWQAVIGDNPSYFQSPDRPVEQVSWEDVKGFLERINTLVPGLDLMLPTEAQWEYACRAGTETAIYTGTIEILGDRNAPALDPIAWYGGNSGVDFDLGNGYNSSGWPEKQYPHTLAGTRPVAGEQPNAVGALRHARQRLGVVCRRAPGLHGLRGCGSCGSTRREPAFPVCCVAAPGTTPRGRVRSAYRDHAVPGHRYFNRRLPLCPSSGGP